MSRVLTLFVLFLDSWPTAECLPHSRVKGSDNTFSSSSKSMEKGVAKIFDDILLQLSPEGPGKASTAGGPPAREDPDEKAAVPWDSEEPDDFLGSMDKLPNDNHVIEERQDRESSPLNKDVTARVLQEATSRALPCAQLLHFLQKNIITVAVVLASILGVLVLWAFVLALCMRRRQPLHPPANMTYNIFIMDEKSWWQKPQENLRKFVEKHKELKCNSSV